MSHLHHRIIAYDEIAQDNYQNGVKVMTVDCKTEEEAITKAKTMINRKQYLVLSVEECVTCAFGEEQMANQRYMSALMSKFLRDNNGING